MDFNDHELSRMSRRRFIRVASAMGVSSACLAFGTRDGLVAAADENYIPYVRAVSGPNPQENPVYGNIHRDEWEVRWTADDAADSINNQIERHFPSDAASGLIDAGWGEMDESPTGYGVRVRYQVIETVTGQTRSPDASIEEVRAKLPNRATGEVASGDHHAKRTVPVVVKRSEQRQTGSLASKDWEDVPGGVPDSSNSGGGTHCAAFYHGDYGEEGMMMSGHVAETTGADVYQVERHGVAEVVYDGSNIDYAWVKMVPGGDNDTDTVRNYVATASGSIDREITEVMTDAEIKNDSRTNDYKGQGDGSGRQTGEPKDISNDWFEWGPNTSGGDSGGPVWKEVNGDAWLAGLIVSDLYLGGTKATKAIVVQERESGYWLTT